MSRNSNMFLHHDPYGDANQIAINVLSHAVCSARLMNLEGNALERQVYINIREGIVQAILDAEERGRLRALGIPPLLAAIEAAEGEDL